jgi:TRAP-type C4-dicarboxylate transport system substrate-binding protein
MSPAVWNKLSAEEKTAFKEAAKVGAQAMRRKAREDAQNGVDELRKQGMEVVTEVDRKAFEDALKPAFAEYAKKFGQAKIDAIRNYKP